MNTAPSPTVTKADIEQKLRQLQGGVEARVMSQRQKIIAGGIAVTVLLLLISYLLGQRKGKRKTTVVEIRRV
jgi:hypothetical protein